MMVLRTAETLGQPIAPGRTRHIIYTDHLMMVVIDFSDGPQSEPDPPHQHPHEQITYVAAGEVLFFIDGMPHHLHPGDMIVVASGVPHTIQLLSPQVRLIDTFTPLRHDLL